MFFSTSLPYNQNSTTYDARHEKMTETEFKNTWGVALVTSVNVA